MCLSSFPNITYGRHYSFLIKHSWFPCQTVTSSLDFMCRGLLLCSCFCSISLCVYFYKVQFCLVYFFFFKFKVASFIFIAFRMVWNQEVWCLEICSLSRLLWLIMVFFFFYLTNILEFFFISLKDSIDILIGIALNMYIASSNWTYLSFFDTLTLDLFPFVSVSFSFLFVCLFLINVL